MNKKVDVAIIGAGTAGLTARREVEKKTKSYVVIDGGILGTTCARVGCMPSKVFIQVANDFHRREKFSAVGISGGDGLSINHNEVMEHVRKLRDRFVRATLSGMEDWKERNFIPKKATFIEQNKLQVGDDTIEAKKIIIATGSRPIIPKEWAEYKKYFITTDEFFEIETLPKKMAVVGLGVIGIELGQALHRLGVYMIGISRRRNIGGLTDPEIVQYASKKFSEEMSLDFSGVQAMSEKIGKLMIRTKNSEYLIDKALISIGRTPNIDHLGLEKLGLTMDENGIPKYDPKTFQVDGTNIFIAGDVNNDKPILHETADEGSIAGHNAVAKKPQSFKRRAPLSITFSSPNIAIVGKSYKELVDERIRFETGSVTFEGQGRSIVKLEEIGLLKVYGSKLDGSILGAELFGPSGEHIAHLLAWMIQNKTKVHELLSMPFYHPVVEEGLRTALRDLASKLPSSPSPLELQL